MVNVSRSGLPVALGIDVGTTNIKAVAVEFGPGDPRVLGRAGRPTPGAVDELVAAALAAVQACLAGPTVAPARSRIRAVGVASMAETGVPLDAADRPLTDLVGWADTRAASLLDPLADAVGATLGAPPAADTRAGAPRSGAPRSAGPRSGAPPPDPIPPAAGLDASAAAFVATGVRLGPKPPLAKWFWFARNERALWSRVRRWAGAGDVVVHALTGRYVTDHTLAGRTGALRLGAEAFDPGLAAVGGLDPDRLPTIARPGEPAGRVRPGAFVDAGIPPGVPVFAAGHDHAVGAYAAGVRALGDVADSLGTSESVYAVVDDVPPAARPGVAAQGMSVVTTVDGDRMAVVGGSPAAGRLIAWWCDVVARDRTPATVFDDANPAAPPGALVLPYLLGRQAPGPDPDARLAVVGLGADDGPGVLAEALRRGLVLHARWLIEAALGVGRLPAGRPGKAGAAGAPLAAAHAGPATGPLITLLGRPTGNLAWMRRKAELTPGTAVRVAEPDAVGAGAALVAAERAGLAVGRLDVQPIAVEPDLRAVELYEAFRAAVRRAH